MRSQVLAQLAATDPELHALLTSGPALDKEEEVEELTRALDSLARMGLGGPQDAEDGGAAAAMEGASEGVPGYEEEVRTGGKGMVARGLGVRRGGCTSEA